MLGTLGRMVLALLLLMSFNSLALAANVNMNPGMWEHTVETKIEGMQMPMGPMTSTVNQCMTKDDLVPETQKDQKSDCQVLDSSISGNTVKWRFKCDTKDSKMEGSGSVTYTGSSYKGSMDFKMKDESGTTYKGSNKMSGRRVGDCTETKAAAPKENKPQRSMAGCAQTGWTPADMQACDGKQKALKFNPGMWNVIKKETRVTTMTSPPQVEKDEDAKDECLGEEFVAPAFISEDACIKDMRREGQRITWTIQCSSMMGTQEGVGEITYAGDSFSGKSESTISNQGMQMFTVKVSYSGSRTGECQKASSGGGRDYSAQPRRDYTAQDRPLGVEDSVNKIKGFFKW